MPNKSVWQQRINQICVIRGFLLEDEVDEGVDVGDVDFTVTIDVACGRCISTQYHVDDGIDVGDIDFAVTVDVSHFQLAPGAINEADDGTVGRAVVITVKV